MQRTNYQREKRLKDLEKQRKKAEKKAKKEEKKGTADSGQQQHDGEPGSTSQQD